MDKDDFFERGIDIQPGAYNGRRGSGGGSPGSQRGYQTFPKSSKQVKFSGKCFRFYESFNEHFAVFQNKLKNLLEFWRNFPFIKYPTKSRKKLGEKLYLRYDLFHDSSKSNAGLIIVQRIVFYWSMYEYLYD